MLQHLSLDSFLKLVKTGQRIAVYREITADRLTPVGIVENLSSEMTDGAILESGQLHQDKGRYSFIAFNTIAQLRVENNMVSHWILDQEPVKSTAHPFIALRQLSSELKCVSDNPKIDAINGAFGFLTYDAIRLFEAIPDKHAAETTLPDMLFNFYQTTLMFDHLHQKLLISIAVEINGSPEQIYQEIQEKINQLIKLISKPLHYNVAHQNIPQRQDTPINIDTSDEQFMQLVGQAKQYIVEGDAFQIVLSRRFTKRYSATPFEIYRALRRVSPAPYMFYFPVENSIIMGASPETMIRVQNRQVEINPIAGTRQRNEKSDDQALTAELLNDTKECAEHMMLVDLARNDLGAVCKPGSVNVDELLQVKHFSHVSHIVSVVTGQLADDKDAFDALAASFPAGTLSGAPKIRAMQIIDELETSKRGMYGGVICRLDYQGNLDSCIAIRMAVLKDGIATVRTGAGVVYDSNPKAEANETRQKAQAVLEAISLAEEGLE